jgi:hypothetical protein
VLHLASLDSECVSADVPGRVTPSSAVCVVAAICHGCGASSRSAAPPVVAEATGAAGAAGVVCWDRTEEHVRNFISIVGKNPGVLLLASMT